MLARLTADLVALVATMVVATFLVFVLTVQLPGDPALALFRARHGESDVQVQERVEEIREEAGFNDPLPVQYLNWARAAVQGDMGESYTTGRAVFPILMERLPVTLLLSFGSVGAAFALAIPTALFTARSRWAHRGIVGITQLGVSLPDYFFAILLVIVFALWWRLLPVSGWGSPEAMILPMVTLAAYPWAVFVRLLATGIHEHRDADWARTARAKGLSEVRLLFRHVFPHAMLPVISILGVLAGGAVASAVVVEVVFAIPGAGRLLFDAIRQRDIPMVQAALLVQVALTVLCSRLADSAMSYANPTLRRGGPG